MQNGWLYFTKEVLIFSIQVMEIPIRLYNGAIGMTYEQGGHSSGGVGDH